MRPWPMLILPALAALNALEAASTTALTYAFPFVDGSTRLGFQSTALEPGARGQAVLRFQDGRARIHAHLQGLGPASRYGPEYLTYVLWSVTPGGRAANLGEAVVRGGRAHLEALTQAPSFGLVVTAEPHFAVTRPSGAVVLECRLQRSAGPGLEGTETPFEVTGDRALRAEVGAASPEEDRAVSPYVFQARNAVRIARLEGAEELAPADFQRALGQLRRLEEERNQRGDAAVVLARRTVQDAEEARLGAGRERETRALAAVKERADQAHAQAEAARDLAVREAAKADRQARAAGEAARQVTEAQLARRAALVEQLNRLLRTRETGEGLLATLTDVAFPSGRSSLSPAARENLAKVAGILLAHPGLRIRVLGHTDASGRPAFNERLSRDRAETVRTFLLEQGLPFPKLEARGMAGSQPVAPNATPEGRRRNRRVDLVVSGEPIGL